MTSAIDSTLWAIESTTCVKSQHLLKPTTCFFKDGSEEVQAYKNSILSAMLSISPYVCNMYYMNLDSCLFVLVKSCLMSQ